MKIHRLLVTQVTRSLALIFLEQRLAEQEIESVLQNQRKWGSRDRRFYSESVYECVRWFRRLAFLAGVSGTQPEDFPLIWAVWAHEKGWIEDPSEWGIKSSVIQNQKQKLLQQSLAVQQSIPDWMDQMGQSELGQDWKPLLEGLNQKAPVDLRVNFLRANLQEVQSRLRAEGIETSPVEGLKSALTLNERKNVLKSRSFQAGLFEIQDRASQLVAPFLDPQPGERIADACAGAGGKTLHLATLMKNRGKIVAIDPFEKKLSELQKRARRNGIDIVETHCLDSSQTQTGFESKFDRVLLDVPCSGLGVLRRTPDRKWKLFPADIERLQNLQLQILSQASKWVRPGGVLVYATCSILPSENQNQIRKFVDASWKVDDELTIWPLENRGDGFYAARLIREKN